MPKWSKYCRDTVYTIQPVVQPVASWIRRLIAIFRKCLHNKYHGSASIASRGKKTATCPTVCYSNGSDSPHRRAYSIIVFVRRRQCALSFNVWFLQLFWLRSSLTPNAPRSVQPFCRGLDFLTQLPNPMLYSALQWAEHLTVCAPSRKGNWIPIY